MFDVDIAHVGYATVAALALGQSLGLPVPAGSALIAAGVLAGDGRLDFLLAVAVALGATVIGSVAAFVIGGYGGAPLLLGRGPLMIRRTQLFDTGRSFMNRHGAFSVLISRFIPVARETSSYLAGTLGMPLSKFIPWNLLGAIAWVGIYVGLGYIVGVRAGVILGSLLLLGVKLILVLVLATIACVRGRRGADKA